MGINCMFQCLTLILSQSPLGQVSSWRICVCYSKHNLKGNDFSYKRESEQPNINVLFIVREWALSKTSFYVRKGKLHWTISDKILSESWWSFLSTWKLFKVGCFFVVGKEYSFMEMSCFLHWEKITMSVVRRDTGHFKWHSCWPVMWPCD